MKPSLLAVLGVAVFALAACGDDDDGGEMGSGGGAQEPTGPGADEGCPDDHPRRWANKVLVGNFRACGTEDATSIVVINTSSASLTVSGVDPNDPVTMRTDARFPESPSFNEQIVASAVSGQCVITSEGPCNLPPSGRLNATGTAPVGIAVEIDPTMTGIATAVSVAGAWAKSRLQNRALRFRDGVVACGTSVKDFLSRSEYIEDSIREAFRLSSCASLYDQVNAEADRPPTAPDDGIAAAFRRAGRYTKNLREDFYVNKLARIVFQIR